jgi:AraC-like DNA-binding protein
LLRATSLPVDKISRLAGFEHPEYMSVVFKRETGDTPGHLPRGASGQQQQQWQSQLRRITDDRLLLLI